MAIARSGSYGDVIQVVYGSTTTQVSTTSTSTTPGVAIGLSATITPRSTSSRVLVSAGIQARIFTTNMGFGLRLQRNGSTIRSDTANYAYMYEGANSGRFPFVYLDSPASTAALTYEFYGGGYTANTLDFQDDNSYYSHIVLMEIAS